MQGKIVFVLKGMQPSCSSSITFSLSLSLSRFNHTRSMHSVYLLLYLNLERSIFACLSPIASMWGRPRTFLCSSGTQNSNSSSWPTIHPSFMPCGTDSYPWATFLCLGCEVHYVVDSDCTRDRIGRQLCSIFNNRCVQLPFWVPALSIWMAGVDVDESYFVCHSSEQRWIDHQGIGHLKQVRDMKYGQSRTEEQHTRCNRVDGSYERGWIVDRA